MRGTRRARTAWPVAIALLAACAPARPPATDVVAAGSAAPPGDSTRAQLFGPGIFSTGDFELTPTFTRDGRTAYFSLSTPVYARMRFILETHRTGEGWSEPVVASFSGQHDDVDPYIAPDGQRLYFLSKRPVRAGERKTDLDIWMMPKRGDGWGEPVHLGDRVNGPADEHYVTATTDGTLYIAAIRPDSRGAGDVYRVRRLTTPGDTGWAEPENLGPVVNGAEHHDTTPLVAPDESWVIFGSRGRPGGLGEIDLYITFRNADGSWTPPRNLGEAVNSAGTDYCPLLSPDGRWLYFASTRHATSGPYAAPLRGRAARELVRAPGNTLSDVYRVALQPLLDAHRPSR